ncbi:ribosome-associated heat shock protein Hsp15 [Marinobacter lutaoensis]|jgi:ribosome-associated heat shock protein Hsp15|uniref:Heat shock protein 15 n=1 Tax=Marinobacter lutaoensis TaxID=135739 RepID=A0A1V2DNM6_9GAMM|nr:ribosome-associated heat shock protein Hsp15 [Marinobacter lutaoensis]MBE02298.1 RNA-binding protein [Marinobacter sp.]MBI43806.1 RNA-binding protein [Oceanospirillales bacterium]NVD35672.1 ribosome-associated heat shock protein Hsp15 [Marinobacter lutaoensis]ONF42254.1 RNA-binding protein [Marinobacter lutaoensis]|tara:strand:+ start:11 stop:418 length:408 start_codon:yes stop_codon:yes gene_type:complete
MTATSADDHKVRLDKWLWAARFYKTRTLAKEAIEGGKVHYNHQRTKPGKLVEPGATVTLRLGWQEKVVVIDDVSDRRRGAPEAQKLYHETEDSVKRREELAWQRKTLQAAQLPPARRPNKKDRRDIRRFREQQGL